MATKTRLVSSALPYANGHIHIGHLVEYIQTDIWVRYNRLMGQDVLYVCADDAHGSPIMIRAQDEGIKAEELIAQMKEAHKQDFDDYHISFDCYHSTHSPENEGLATLFYEEALKKGAVFEKDIEQFYSEAEGMFLSDRFVKGGCPRCKAPDQYGDACEQCGATYDALELIEPYCVRSKTTPVLKTSSHVFFDLAQFESVIKAWLSQDVLPDSLKNKLNEWLSVGLKAWDISRDAPYFGFLIPRKKDKYFYVWLDAPIGYIAATKAYCDSKGQSFEAFWKREDVEIHHFIGKDILYFHALFWPALLDVAGFNKPKKLHVHGFLTVNGEKMSKSKGTFILARKMLNAAPADYLRYYYASKLMPTPEDMDLNMDDFVFKVNADIVNKFLNIGSRTAKILEKHCDLTLCAPDQEGEVLLRQLYEHQECIIDHYEHVRFAKAMREILELAQAVNRYIDAKEPWSVVKEDVKKAQETCSSALQALFFIAGLLQPVMPEICKQVFAFLSVSSPSFLSLQDRFKSSHQICSFSHLGIRLKKESVLEDLTI